MRNQVRSSQLYVLINVRIEVDPPPDICCRVEVVLGAVDTLVGKLIEITYDTPPDTMEVRQWFQLWPAE